MTAPTDYAKLGDEIEALAKAIERAKANPPEPSYHIDGGERSRAFDSYVHDLMAAVVLKLPAIIAALRELDALKAREAKLREPEWFYNADDGEYTYGDVNDTVDDMGYEGVMRVGGAREVWVKWAAVKCVALDPDDEVDETEVHTFDTEAEALRCWPDSLASCRARTALGGNFG